MIMRNITLSIGLRAVPAMLAVTLLVANSYAATDEVLHSFKSNGKDGINPYAGLVFDRVGNLYGTTYGGGTHGDGTVFELTLNAKGRWTEKILHSFSNSDGDGFGPLTGLIIDRAGDLYGTAQGGTYNHGMVFELMPLSGGGWTEKVLYSFSNSGKDGDFPSAGVIMDANGNLYGTTGFGGNYNYGTAFELTPKADGHWTEKMLYMFDSEDGNFPSGGLIFASEGDLYGTTQEGGAYNYGVAFELKPKADGQWTEKILYSFGNNDADGTFPYAGLIFDTGGNLYGTTIEGGIYNYGTAFELMPEADGRWTKKLLHSFGNSEGDGQGPGSNLIFGRAGDLCGTTYAGGTDGRGTVFKLTPKAGGHWTEEVLHSFNLNDKEGIIPQAGLIADRAGNLYTTTSYGGAYGEGTVFEIAP
jgi:uncharacterized repeat protein (TIGR03803 family)